MKQLLEPLFGVAKKRNQIRERIILTHTTENLEKLMQLINSVVKLPGLNRSIVPSLRTLRRQKPEIDGFFTSLLEPEQTYSGFRVSLVFAVKYIAYLILGLRNLRGLEVALWGDGLEIGKLEMTRFAFRFLGYVFNAQSDQAVFTFAIFRGHDSRFILENNNGCSVLGEQETGSGSISQQSSSTKWASK